MRQKSKTPNHDWILIQWIMKAGEVKKSGKYGKKTVQYLSGANNE